MRRPSTHPRGIPASTWLLTIVAFSIVGLLYASLRNRQRSVKSQMARTERQIRDQQNRASSLTYVRSKLIERDDLKTRVERMKLPLHDIRSSEIRRLPFVEPPVAPLEGESAAHE